MRVLISVVLIDIDNNSFRNVCVPKEVLKAVSGGHRRKTVRAQVPPWALLFKILSKVSNITFSPC